MQTSSRTLASALMLCCITAAASAGDAGPAGNPASVQDTSFTPPADASQAPAETEELPELDEATSTADEASNEELRTLDEVVVTGAGGTPPPAAIERQSTAVTDAISVEDLDQAGDSDIAASLKRVAGVSIQGGRFAVVRGLASRYISTTLNGDLLASTDPYRRDVELDLFPSGILSGIEIQKSFSADMPGDTTGGAIRITTREISPNFNANVSISTGATSGATGDSLFSYRGGNRDWLGTDDGTRALPRIIDEITSGGRENPSSADSAAWAGTLPNIYNLTRRNAAPDYGVSVALGNGIPMSSGIFGFYGMLSYGHGTGSHQDGTRADPRNVTQASYSRDSFETGIDGYAVIGFESDANWSLYSKTTLLRRTEDTAEFESGLDVDDDTVYNETLLEFTERQFLAEQLQAKLRLFRNHELGLRAGVSQTSSETPDRRSYRYQNQRFVSTSLERLYADLKEDALDLGVDYSLPLQVTGSVETKVKIGALFDQRDRSNDLVRLGIAPVSVDSTEPLESLLTPENFANGTYRLYGSSTDTDSYEAEQQSLAAYLSTETSFGYAFTVVAGVRLDNFETTLQFPHAGSTPEVTLRSEELLPSLGLIYRLGDNTQFRGAWSRTVSRPSISELSPSVFFDDRGRRFTGCTVQTIQGLRPCRVSTIDNFDLRAEYYLNRADSISLAAFHKDIDAPLERGLLDGGTSGFTYRNSDSATVSGLELDGQMSWFLGAGHSLTLGANISYIDSKISLDADGQRIEGIASRELQGQSPLLANARLSYEHPASQQTATLAFNYYDERIDVAGGNGLQPVFEKGRRVLNLTYEKKFINGSSIGIKLRNLLDDDNVYVQRNNANTATVVERWRSGIGGEISYSHDF